MAKLTKAQRAMLEEAVRGHADRGVIMFDHYQERVARNLYVKGLVTLPPGFGFVYGSMHGVRITDAGRAALTERKSTDG